MNLRRSRAIFVALAATLATSIVAFTPSDSAIATQPGAGWVEFSQQHAGFRSNGDYKLWIQGPPNAALATKLTAVAATLSRITSRVFNYAGNTFVETPSTGEIFVVVNGVNNPCNNGGPWGEQRGCGAPSVSRDASGPWYGSGVVTVHVADPETRTLLHEIGHAVGLGHFGARVNGQCSETYGGQAQLMNANTYCTVNGLVQRPSTYMAGDIDGLLWMTRTDPEGQLLTASATGSSVTVTGWAADPNSSASTPYTSVQITDNGVVVQTVIASIPRPDLSQLPYQPSALNRGFSVTYTPGVGSHVVCAKALNIGPGKDFDLGCRAPPTVFLYAGSVGPTSSTALTLPAAGGTAFLAVYGSNATSVSFSSSPALPGLAASVAADDMKGWTMVAMQPNHTQSPVTYTVSATVHGPFGSTPAPNVVTLTVLPATYGYFPTGIPTTSLNIYQRADSGVRAYYSSATDHQIREVSYNAGSGWATSAALTNAPVAAGTAISAFQYDNVGSSRAYFVGAADRQIRELSYNSGSGWATSGALTTWAVKVGTSPSGLVYGADGSARIYYVAAVDSQIHELSYNPGTSWTTSAALTTMAVAAGTSPSALLYGVNGAVRVYYVGASDNQIHELSFNLGSGWATSAALTTVAVASASSPSGLVLDTSGNVRVYYVGASDGQIHELSYNTGIGWATSAALTTHAVAAGSTPTGFLLNANAVRVHYVGATGRQIHELSYNAGQGWANTGALTSVQAATWARPTGFAYGTSGAARIYYEGASDSRIHELAYNPGSGWTNSGAPSLLQVAP